MTSIALVLLAPGLLFATLQYPAPMKRFWKWALIVGILAPVAFYGSMFVLANFFEPQPRDMTKSIRDAKIR
jgi:hypothetical protein